LSFWIRGALLLGLATTGCVVSADADLPLVEISHPGVAVPALPAGDIDNDQSWSFTFTQAVGQLKVPSGLVPSVREVETLVSASDGVTDLGFIHDLRITVNGTGEGASGLAPSEVAVYQHPSAAPTGPILVAPAGDTSRLLDHWKAQPLLFTVSVAGQLPADPWSIDLAVRVGLRLSK
jgi:hypothetical protein